MSLMRECMLRVSEAAAARCGDIEQMEDDTGRLLIRRSKNDQEGKSAKAFISGATMEAIRCIRNGAAEEDSVFGMRRNQISSRIKQAAKHAGLGDGFSGHSPRVGMAIDLARYGIELPRLMVAGRWRLADDAGSLHSKRSGLQGSGRAIPRRSGSPAPEIGRASG